MSKIQVTNVRVLDNPSFFSNPIQLEITFECLEDLSEDLEWKVVYVGSGESENLDQTLDSVLVGPIPSGRHMFVFQAPAPDPARIPPGDLVGVAALILTCAFRDKEFVRVGYYVNNDYDDPELREEPPAVPVVEKLRRDILESKPIVTRFKIDWGDEAKDQVMEGEAGDKENMVPMSMEDDSSRGCRAEGDAESLKTADLDPALQNGHMEIEAM